MNTKLTKQLLMGLMCCLLLQFTVQAGSFGPAGQSDEQSAAPTMQQSAQDLQQLVAPIALYPDSLVAQILAASTYPTEIVEADRWMQSHSNLKGEELAAEVDKQPWDPSVKALTQFPSVLENMDKNLSWASSLGDAYANQQQDVMDAVQTMRQQAQKAGNLNSNDQENVTTQSNSIVIAPANPDVVYVPEYDPWVVYGSPIVAYPGWYPVPGIFYNGPGLFFGAGLGIGFFGGYGWGWNHWGSDWHGHRMIYNHNTYISHSRTIVNRNNFNHGNFNRGAAFGNRPGSDRNSISHGSSLTHAQQGMHTGAFSGFDHGGNVRGFSSRGQSSFGGGFHAGGGFHGAGGFHGGGGGHGGGGHR
jgi:hypothetical protein